LLELGAAVYVIKPFGIGELIALARAALQPRIGTTSANDPIVRVGALQINLATRSGTIDGRQLVLGPKEYLELEILAAARRQGEGPGSIQTLSHFWFS
jgi:DNA-binding response OmpR family regulator